MKPFTGIRKFFLGSCSVVLLTSAVHAQVAGKWVKLAPFPEPAEELYGIAASGKMYVFGGLAPGWKPRALVFEYDPAANKWNNTSSDRSSCSVAASVIS